MNSNFVSHGWNRRLSDTASTPSPGLLAVALHLLQMHLVSTLKRFAQLLKCFTSDPVKARRSPGLAAMLLTEHHYHISYCVHAAMNARWAKITITFDCRTFKPQCNQRVV